MTTESLSAFAARHHVSRNTAYSWKARGYVQMRRGGVDVEKSNSLLAQRPQVYRGGKLGGNSSGSPHTEGRELVNCRDPRAVEREQLAAVDEVMARLREVGLGACYPESICDLANVLLASWGYEVFVGDVPKTP